MVTRKRLVSVIGAGQGDTALLQMARETGRLLAERGFVVVAISSDVEGRSIVEPFIESLGVTFPVLLDPDGQVSAAYGANNLPVSFLLDRDGRVVAAAVGVVIVTVGAVES